MKVLNVRNVNDALPMGLDYLSAFGLRRQSRNGPVLVAPGPVMTVYGKPLERVLHHEQRDANPFFHVVEAVWMLAGLERVDLLTPYVARMAEFSDDGATLSGAYGYRWRNYFGKDQLDLVISELKERPDSRRAVIGMWDGGGDLPRALEGGKDVPCNTHIYFNQSPERPDTLEMTICCRSNDVVWGAYGANAVHFSYLMEYVACALGWGVGTMYQLSNNYHIYPDRADVQRLRHVRRGPDPYTEKVCKPFPQLFKHRVAFDAECRAVFEAAPSEYLYSEPWIGQVLMPMMRAHKAYREGAYHEALIHTWMIKDTAWQLACLGWLKRRIEK